MNIEILNNYKTDENTYLVYEGNTAIVIDPGNNDTEIIKKAQEKDVKIKYILITHCHYDHIEFMEELRKKTGAKLICGDKASINIKDPDINLSWMGLGRKIVAKQAEIILKDGEEFDADGIKIKCIYTPGHTNCSVCFKIEDKIFTGDTLFLRNCGRWDLPTGDGETLVKSVKEKLYVLDDEITLFPGHGNKTSIGYEKKFNLYIKE